VESELVAIGEVARRSGLTVSALRYYDEAGVLVPIVVDSASGYRFYGPTQVRLARLVARLRRVGLPVAVLRQVVADPRAAGPLLDAHLGRLEHALTDARRELSAARALLEEERAMTLTTTVTTTRTALATALRAVRFAVGSDPELPAINGVLLDAVAEGPRLVATDRYRLAVSPLEAAVEGPDAQALLPTEWVDDLLRRLAEPGERPDVVVEVSGEKVTASVDGITSATARPALDYPDYRRLVRDRRPGVVVQPESLRAGLETASAIDHTAGADGVARRVALLAGDGGDITVPSQPGHGAVAFDRDFLLQAIQAANGAPLTLALDGPPEPLVIRTPDGGISLLMPVPLT
jgi:DNA-binding transcriptional MerR regulator